MNRHWSRLWRSLLQAMLLLHTWLFHSHRFSCVCTKSDHVSLCKGLFCTHLLLVAANFNRLFLRRGLIHFLQFYHWLLLLLLLNLLLHLLGYLSLIFRCWRLANFEDLLWTWPSLACNFHRLVWIDSDDVPIHSLPILGHALLNILLLLDVVRLVCSGLSSQGLLLL